MLAATRVSVGQENGDEARLGPALRELGDVGPVVPRGLAGR